jgi:hypothetical protein
VRNPRESLEGAKLLFKNHREFLEGDKLCRSGQGFLGGGMFDVKRLILNVRAIGNQETR